MGMQNGTVTLEDSLTASYKTSKYTLTVWSRNCTPGIYPNELKSYIHTKTCTWMFLETLLMIPETWKQPRCLSVDKWIDCGTSRQWNTIQFQKEMSYQAMKRHGRNLNAYY